MMELWQLMAIGFLLWGVYSLTKPIVKPTCLDKQFKKMLEDEIKELQLSSKSKLGGSPAPRGFTR